MVCAKITASDSRGTNSREGKLSGGIREAYVCSEGAVGWEAGATPLPHFLRGPARRAPEQQHTGERSVRLHRLPHFSQDGVFVPQLWSGRGKPVVLQAACLGSAEWLVRSGSLLCPARNHSPSLGCVLITPPSQRKNPPNSGQPNRFPYIGKTRIAFWWKKLTRKPVTWLTLHTPEWLSVSQPEEALVTVQRDLCNLIKISSLFQQSVKLVSS